MENKGKATDKRKLSDKKYYESHKEQKAVSFHNYYEGHKEQKRLRDKKYRENPEHKKTIKEWFLRNKEYILAYNKRYYKEHSDIIRQQNGAYSKSPKGKIVHKITASKRRSLGFIPLNKWFEGCEGHHIDKERVVYIPKYLHRSVWHSQTSGVGMEEINKLAFDYLKMENSINGEQT